MSQPYVRGVPGSLRLPARSPEDAPASVRRELRPYFHFLPPLRRAIVTHHVQLHRLAGQLLQLAAIMKNRLKRIQYRPALIDGFLAQTGLSIEPGPP
jgi:hypothetical protein